MFSLFDGVWRLNSDSIVKQLKKSLLGDYAEDLGQFVTDVKADVVETVTDWGKAFGLAEDKKADLDLLVEQAQDRMQPIIERYRPEPEEFKTTDPELGMEMTDLNRDPGDGLNETLYELEEMEGKMGTEFYSIWTEEGLENTLELLNDAKWNAEMEMVEVDPILQAELAEQRLVQEPAPVLEAQPLVEEPAPVDPLEAQPYNQWSTEQPVPELEAPPAPEDISNPFEEVFGEMTPAGYTNVAYEMEAFPEAEIGALEGGAELDAGELAADFFMTMGEMVESLLMLFPLGGGAVYDTTKDTEAYKEKEEMMKKFREMQAQVHDVFGVGKKVWFWESGYWYDGTIIWTQDITLNQPLMMTQAQISFYDENGDLSQRAMSRLYTFDGQGRGRFQSQTGNDVIPKFVPKESTIGRWDPRLDPTITYWWPAEKLQKGGQVKVNGTWHNLILVNVYKGDRVDLVYADGKRDMVYPYDTYMFRWRAPTVDPYVLAALFFTCYENDRLEAAKDEEADRARLAAMIASNVEELRPLRHALDDDPQLAAEADKYLNAGVPFVGTVEDMALYKEAFDDLLSRARTRFYEVMWAPKVTEPEPEQEEDATLLALLEQLEYLKPQIFDNPDLWNRIDDAIWDYELYTVPGLQALVDEANEFLRKFTGPIQEVFTGPIQEVFTGPIQQTDDVTFGVAGDNFVALEDHSEELQALHDKARMVREWVPKDSDLYWELTDALYLGWDERKRIKDAIRRAKAYKPVKEEKEPEKEPEKVVPEKGPEKEPEKVPEEAVPVPEPKPEPLPIETHYITIAGEHETVPEVVPEDKDTRRRLPEEAKAEETDELIIPERDFILDYFMVDASWLSTQRQFAYGPTFFTDWVNNIYEFVSIYNEMSAGTNPSGGMLQVWPDTVASKDYWKTRDQVVKSEDIGAKSVSVTKSGTAIFPSGTFGKYEAISRWKGQIKKLLGADPAELEQKAFNWLWETKPAIIHRDALRDLQNGTNPVTASGTYWRTLRQTNFSLVEQLNFHNGAGFDCLRGTGWLAEKGEFRAFVPSNRADALDYMYKYKTHVGKFLSEVTEPDDKGQTPKLSMTFTADDILMKESRFREERKVTLVHGEGEEPVTFDHLPLCFVPLDAVPRAHFSKEQVMASDELKGRLITVMTTLVSGYGGARMFSPLAEVPPYPSKLWVLMENMRADIERVIGWVEEAQLPFGDAMDTYPHYDGAVPEAGAGRLETSKVWPRLADQFDSYDFSGSQMPEPEPEEPGPARRDQGLDTANILEGKRERRPALPRSDVFSTGRPESVSSTEANPYAWVHPEPNPVPASLVPDTVPLLDETIPYEQASPLEFGTEGFEFYETEYWTKAGVVEKKAGSDQLQRSKDQWLANQPDVEDSSSEEVALQGNLATRWLRDSILPTFTANQVSWEDLQALFYEQRSLHKQYRTKKGIQAYMDAALGTHSSRFTKTMADIGFPDWIMTDDGMERVIEKPVKKESPEPERAAPVDVDAPVKPEPAKPEPKPEPAAQAVFNGTSIDPIVLEAALREFAAVPEDILGDLNDNVLITDPNPGGLPSAPYMPALEERYGEVDTENIISGGFEAPVGLPDPDLVELRRSSRAVPAVSYKEGVNIDDLEARRIYLLQNIMVHIPQELKEAIIEEMQWFSPDAYIRREQFVCEGELRQNLQFPADIFDAGEEVRSEGEMSAQYELMGIMLRDGQDSLWKQFAVALMWKHTIRVLSQLVYPVNDGIWRTGEDWDDGMSDEELQRTNQQLDDTVAAIEAQWPSGFQALGQNTWEDWPKNFMHRPSAFPDQIRGNLGTYADTHLEAVQQGALQIDRTVREIKQNRPVAEAPEEVPAPVDEVVSEEDLEQKAESPDESMVERIKNQLLDAIRSELPPPPPPIEVHIVQDKKEEEGDSLRWAFGLALSLWVVYNME